MVATNSVLKVKGDPGLLRALHLLPHPEGNVRELAAELSDPAILPCDVTRDEDLDALAESVRKELGGLDFVVHAVAFAMREELDGEFLNASREGYRLAQDISSYSLTALGAPDGAAHGERRQHPDAQLPGRRARGAALQRDGRGQGGAGDVGALPGRRPGPRGIRVNAISAGPIKTLAASGVHGISKMLEYHRTHAPCGATRTRTRSATRRCSCCRRCRAA